MTQQTKLLRQLWHSQPAEGYRFRATIKADPYSRDVGHSLWLLVNPTLAQNRTVLASHMWAKQDQSGSHPPPVGAIICFDAEVSPYMRTNGMGGFGLINLRNVAVEALAEVRLNVEDHDMSRSEIAANQFALPAAPLVLAAMERQAAADQAVMLAASRPEQSIVAGAQRRSEKLNRRIQVNERLANLALLVEDVTEQFLQIWQYAQATAADLAQMQEDITADPELSEERQDLQQLSSRLQELAATYWRWQPPQPTAHEQPAAVVLASTPPALPPTPTLVAQPEPPTPAAAAQPEPLMPAAAAQPEPPMPAAAAQPEPPTPAAAAQPEPPIPPAPAMQPELPAEPATLPLKPATMLPAEPEVPQPDLRQMIADAMAKAHPAATAIEAAFAAPALPRISFKRPLAGAAIRPYSPALVGPPLPTAAEQAPTEEQTEAEEQGRTASQPPAVRAKDLRVQRNQIVDSVWHLVQRKQPPHGHHAPYTLAEIKDGQRRDTDHLKLLGLKAIIALLDQRPTRKELGNRYLGYDLPREWSISYLDQKKLSQEDERVREEIVGEIKASMAAME